ncbi:family 20 glycosylhydrolase, partial [Acinetobacter baumannii]|nr:family 20 glycosylhydrolase [Acinetobacter baumannii]
MLEEVMDVFPSTYIHVGGDEAAKASWPSCPLCQAKMKELGINKVDGLQAHLITHMGKFLAKHGRQLVGWDEVIAGDL